MRREQVLGRLHRLVKEWVQKVSALYGMSDVAESGTNAKIYTFGSYRLGVHGPGKQTRPLSFASQQVCPPHTVRLLLGTGVKLLASQELILTRCASARAMSPERSTSSAQTSTACSGCCRCARATPCIRHADCFRGSPGYQMCLLRAGCSCHQGMPRGAAAFHSLRVACMATSMGTLASCIRLGHRW